MNCCLEWYVWVLFSSTLIEFFFGDVHEWEENSSWKPKRDRHNDIRVEQLKQECRLANEPPFLLKIKYKIWMNLGNWSNVFQFCNYCMQRNMYLCTCAGCKKQKIMERKKQNEERIELKCRLTWITYTSYQFLII